MKLTLAKGMIIGSLFVFAAAVFTVYLGVKLGPEFPYSQLSMAIITVALCTVGLIYLATAYFVRGRKTTRRIENPETKPEIKLEVKRLRPKK